MSAGETTCIAVAGKGGVGKTLLSGLLVRHLAATGQGPVLAVDADPNANLHQVLGIAPGSGVGAIREEMKQLAGQLPAGMTRPQFLEYKVETDLAEGDNFDLLVMGRPEGPGCYCYANNLLRDILARVSGRYRHVVIDNEAGMEHLSRRLAQELDLLLVVSDASLRGVETAYRISDVPPEVETRVARRGLVVNRVPAAGLAKSLEARLVGGPVPLLGTIADDPEVALCDQEPDRLATVFPDSAMARAVAELATRFL